MVVIDLECKMCGEHTVLLFLLLIHFPTCMHTDSSVEDGNADAGQGENDEKEQKRKVKCLSLVCYTHA